jgi:hypothetical protein
VKRQAFVWLLAIFVATRIAGAVLADHPKLYEHGGSIVGDVILYQYWGERIADHGLVPYRDVRIEYPPGSLPFVAGPALAPGSAYRAVFIAIMLLVDAFGLVGLLRLARARGSLLGPWLWVALVPMLGPVAYLRLDLVPAVATIWALERGSKRAWDAAGAWLGFGAVAKLYPVVLLPPLLAFSRLRKPLVRGAILVAVVTLVPFGAWGTAMVNSVLRYHLEREIEIESVWGAALLLASKLGLAVRMDFSSESLNVVSSLTSELKAAAAVLIVAGLATATWLGGRAARSHVEERLADLAFATLAIVVALATVLSPQYVLWLAAIGAAATCSPRSTVRGPVLLLLPVALLTQVLYPFLFVRLAAVDSLALTTLVARDLLLLALAMWALVAIGRSLPRRQMPASRRRSPGRLRSGMMRARLAAARDTRAFISVVRRSLATGGSDG